MKQATQQNRHSRNQMKLVGKFSQKTKKRLLFAVLVLACIGAQSHVAKSQIISTVAGNRMGGYTGDGGPAIFAGNTNPYSVAVDNLGNYYFTDPYNYVVRKVNAAGIISTVAGNGSSGYSGDTGPATNAQLSFPQCVTADQYGNIFISDYNSTIRKVDATGIITTYAGINGAYGYTGDGIPATTSELYYPFGIKVDLAGNLFIADIFNRRIRKVDVSGTIWTVAGDGSYGGSGDGGPALSAELGIAEQVTVDLAGNIYIADVGLNDVRMVNISSGIINRFAGTSGSYTFSGDGGPATAADLAFNNPGGLCADASGNIYIADIGNNRIRVVNSAGIINTVAGNGTAGWTGDGGPALLAELNAPMEPQVDNAGNLFIADWNNNVIREVAPADSAHPCVDSSSISLSAITDLMGNCHYFATARITTSNYVLGYEWSGVGTATIHHTHSDSDYYSFILPAGSSGTVSVTAYLIDTNFVDTTSGPCCQATFSQTVTCAVPPCNGFDTMRTRVFGRGGDMPDSCRFNLTAQSFTMPGWSIVEYDWYILPSLTPAVVDYSTMPLDNVTFTFILGYVGDIQVVFKAVNRFGDTCTCTKTIHLDCSAHSAGRHAGTATGAGISIFPNPTDNAVTISSTDEEITTIQVIDVNGKKVKDYSFDHVMQANVTLDNLPPGAYLLKVNNGTSKVVTKIN